MKNLEHLNTPNGEDGVCISHQSGSITQDLKHPNTSNGVRISRRAKSIKPFIVMDVLSQAVRLAKKDPPPGGSILHLEIGQPSVRAPKHVFSTMDSILRQPLGYTPALGLESFRKAVAAQCYRRYNVSVPPNLIAITTGASGAFLAVFATCFDAGDRVAIGAPGYPCYRHLLNALNAQVAIVQTTEHQNFQPTVHDLRRLHKEERLSGVVIASPSNPAGTVLTTEELHDIARFCDEEGLTLIVDEVYHGVWEKPVTSALTIRSPRIIVIGSLSKYWCMTGFRIGWAIVQCPKLMSSIANCVQNMAICAPTLSQRLGEVAISGVCDSELDAIVKGYFRSAEVLVEWLLKAGFEASVPPCAFFVYARCTSVCERLKVDGSLQLCHQLLHECGVACTPGMDFDEKDGKNFVRFSCAGGMDVVREAGPRIYQFVTQRASNV